MSFEEWAQKNANQRTKKILTQKKEKKEEKRLQMKKLSKISWVTTRGRKSESRTARRYGFKEVPGSGCGPVNKGDFKDSKFLVQHKDTKKFILNRRILLDIIQDAKECFPERTPALFVVLTETKKEFTVIPVPKCTEAIDIDQRGKRLDQSHIGKVYKISHRRYAYWRVSTVTTLLELQNEGD